MRFVLLFTESAAADLAKIKHSPHLGKRFKAVSKALKYLSENPRHPGLNTHEFTSLKGPNKEKVYEAYAENNTPGAYRIFFYYGPERQEMTVVSIIPHP